MQWEGDVVLTHHMSMLGLIFVAESGLDFRSCSMISSRVGLEVSREGLALMALQLAVACELVL